MCTDLLKVEADVSELDEAGVDYYHIDVMDGQFVPNFALSPDFVQRVRQVTNKPLDIHMMVERPERYLEIFADAGADMISIHAEATPHLQGSLATIRELGLKAGVAVNPGTPIHALEHVLDTTDYICLMTVNPGFAGQAFIPAMYDKIKALRNLIDRSGFSIKIEVDGNIGQQTIPRCRHNGADMFVCGTSSVYKPGSSLSDNVQATRSLLKI